MIKIETPPLSFADYYDCSLSTSGFTKKTKATIFVYCLACTILFLLKTFFSFEFLSENKFLIDIFFILAICLMVVSICYRFIAKSFFNSLSSLFKAEHIELSEEYIKSWSECMKLTLPKNLIKQIIFKKDAVYISFFNQAIILLKKNFKDESHWKEMLDFVKANYAGEKVIIKNM